MSIEAQVDKLTVDDKAPAASGSSEEKSSEDKTALETLDFSVTHPLDQKWTLWYMKPAQGSQTDWADLMKELVTVSTVEEFWGAFNSVPRVTQLPLRADFAFFKAGVRPEWEDPANKNGGRWAIHMRMSDEMDSKWLNILLTLIGGTLDTNDIVNGVFAMVRPKGMFRIQMWVKGDHNASLAVARNFKNALNLSEKSKIDYQPFTQADEGGLTVKIEL